jgi:dTDP-4-amino-4,6-dideoxygalactose transaminase
VTSNERIFLSPPDVGDAEREALLAALESGWVAPVGPALDAFEHDVAAFTGTAHAVALSSGTAALHLALLTLGVGPGDEVIVPTLTFVATANAVTYTGARPVLVDADPATWQIDPDLLAEALADRARSGRLPAAVIAVDLYGQCADYDRLAAICDECEVPLIEDAAEALGATYRGRAAGSFGRAGVFSFNGNKIITTSGGGMLVTDDTEMARRVRYLSTQAREPVVHYEHTELGFNYRMSNLLAAVGTAQLAGLPAKMARRRHINAVYRDELGDLPGVSFMPIADYGQPNCWLTCLTIDSTEARADRDTVLKHLAHAGIEARPVWKPMHLQPLYAEAGAVAGACAERLFDTGMCLPSGSSLGSDGIERVVSTVHAVLA